MNWVYSALILVTLAAVIFGYFYIWVKIVKKINPHMSEESNIELGVSLAIVFAIVAPAIINAIGSVYLVVFK